MLQYTNSPMITKYSVYMFKIVDNLLKTYYFVCWVVQKIVCLQSEGNGYKYTFMECWCELFICIKPTLLYLSERMYIVHAFILYYTYIYASAYFTRLLSGTIN